jgi:hypothetical protein
MKEVWKDIKDFEGLYQISNLGRVKSLEREYEFGVPKAIKKLNEKIFNVSLNSNGYPTIRLSKNNKGKTISVHRLVAEAFINNEDNLECVDHINSDRTDNRVDNLRWCSKQENNRFINRKKKHHTSNKVGVHYYKATNKYRAKIVIDGKENHIGYFKTEQEAADAYDNYVFQLNKG